jgi:hypothetical protein
VEAEDYPPLPFLNIVFCFVGKKYEKKNGLLIEKQA